MALRMTVTSDEGLTVDKAYIRIQSAKAAKEAGGGKILIETEIFRDADAAADSLARVRVAALRQFEFDFDVSARVGDASLFALGYGLLKSLPEFDAVEDA